ncbi:MAG: hypothetical protein AAFN79_00355 [Pseudomonadota bacterium]
MTAATLIPLTTISPVGPSTFSPVAGLISDPALLGVVGVFIALWTAALAAKKLRLRASREERD